jgi:hypothetical protein
VSDTSGGWLRGDVAVGLLTRIRERPGEVLDAIARSMNVRASEMKTRTVMQQPSA